LRDYITNYPENSLQFHLPTTQFVGPGTHVITKIVNSVMPTSATDAIALKHDVDYLIANDNYNEIVRADMRAITQSDFGIQGLLMKLGLSTKLLLGYSFHSSNTPGLSKLIGMRAKNYVKLDEQYRNKFSELGVSLDDW
jgi:hypothetical protein